MDANVVEADMLDTLTGAQHQSGGRPNLLTGPMRRHILSGGPGTALFKGWATASSLVTVDDVLRSVGRNLSKVSSALLFSSNKTSVSDEWAPVVEFACCQAILSVRRELVDDMPNSVFMAHEHI